jgi:hypothetical protein
LTDAGLVFLTDIIRRDVRDKDAQYMASRILMPTLTFPWYILFLQMTLWRPSHGGITIPPLTEEMLLKACPEAKVGSPYHWAA